MHLLKQAIKIQCELHNALISTIWKDNARFLCTSSLSAFFMPMPIFIPHVLGELWLGVEKNNAKKHLGLNLCVWVHSMCMNV